MTLRGKAAIVGFAELPTRRTYPGRTTLSLCAEAARLAMADAGLQKIFRNADYEVWTTAAPVAGGR